MRQQGLNIVAPIKNGQVEELRKVLKQVQDEVNKEMQGQSTRDHLIRFTDTGTHLARLVLVDFDPGYPPQLLFGSNHDGKRDDYLDKLIQAGGPGLDAVWSNCKGYPERGTKDPKAVKKFFNDHSVPISTYYVCYPGISVKSARNALEVFGKIGNFLDKNRAEIKGLPTKEIVEKINQFVKDEKIDLVEGALPRKNRLFGPILILVVLILLPILLIPVLILYVLLRRQEEIERKEYHRTHTSNYVPSKVALAQEAQEIVAVTVQTQMTLADPIKPTFVRRVVLKIVLFLINVVARFSLNQGKLGDVRTIHFARWFPIDDGKRLIFFSNFDESWQQYIGVFVDLLPIYLTAIWSNVLRYPPTKNLVQEGAEDMEGFMQFIREFQIPAGVFYSAYSHSSAQNIVNAVQMRQQLGKKMNEKEREAWLRRFAGTLALEDQKYPPRPEENLVDPKVKDPGNHADIQAWIFTGYKRATRTNYLFLKINDATQARAWLKDAAEVTTAIETGWPDPVNIAFTAGGLKALGLPENALLTFPTAFRQGIAQEYDTERKADGTPSPRSQNLGDTGESAPEHWDVGGPKKPFDVLVILHAAGDEALERHTQTELARIEKYGGLEVSYVQTAHRPTKKAEVASRTGTRKKTILIEHFGFRDGIAEPAIRDSGFNKTNQVTMAAGEFILGYKNQYDFFPPTPSVQHELDTEGWLPRTWRPTARQDLGRNGTFVVFRKLSQDVPAFWKYFEEHTASKEEMIHLASRTVGRWPDGTPLTLSPGGPNPKLASVDRANDFLYVKDGDLHGYKCPFASHIRRSNPRDSLSTTQSLTIADRHHIIRRGVAYGDVGTLPPWDGEMPEDDGQERGLMFFAINTSLRRQFEFVQIAWNNSPRFNGLYNTTDPVMGPNPPNLKGDVALEAEPYRLRTRKCPRFTGVKGGAYLFLPSISALRFLARLPV